MENQPPNVNSLTDKELQIKLAEYKMWTETSTKHIDLIFKSVVFVITASGAVVVFNLNNNFEFPFSLSLLFIALLCGFMSVIFGYPAFYLISSCKRMEELTTEINAKLRPTLDLLQRILSIFSVLFLLLSIIFSSLFFRPCLFGIQNTVSNYEHSTSLEDDSQTIKAHQIEYQNYRDKINSSEHKLAYLNKRLTEIDTELNNLLNKPQKSQTEINQIKNLKNELLKHKQELKQEIAHIKKIRQSIQVKIDKDKVLRDKYQQQALHYAKLEQLLLNEIN